MKFYPSIEYPTSTGHVDDPCIAFYKYDGSNLRFEWSNKRGWWKFGTRNHLFDKSCPEYGCAIDIFLNKYGDGIAKIITDKYQKCEHAIAFAEYFGPHSFSGQHDCTRLQVESNDPKDLMLFDINIHRRGIIGPQEFLDNFGALDIAKVVYEGPMSEAFLQDIWEGRYPVVEGVICKGGEGHKLWMAKAKTKAYKNKLIDFFKQNWKTYW